jgi:hypothetical protein
MTPDDNAAQDAPQEPKIAPGVEEQIDTIGQIVVALHLGPRSRERSLAITKLEEAALWLGAELRNAPA